ncbi:OLC1v1004089C2 [Oldenlandia corymbosa var. corymbosa]|nr:OLC1v1004089C2 [Oldenlandia corymbosa var. corymbosa]
MGAHQFDQPKERGIFFNWYALVMDVCVIVSSTGIVYVINNVSWAWGFGITAITNIFALLLFFVGTGFFRELKPQGSPFPGLASVIIRAIKNRGTLLSQDPIDYYQHHENETNPTLPSKFFRFLNHAALKIEGDTEQNGSPKKSWQFCTVKKVEDLKSLIKLIPLWTSAILVCIPYIIQTSLGILQALTMDRHLGHNAHIAAASVVAVLLVSGCITILFIDRILFPMWNKFGLQPITPLQRICIGHCFYILSMAISAFVEAKRLKIVRIHNLRHEDNALVPMSIYWLVPSYALVGIAEAFNFPGQVEFYYREFPQDMKNTSSAIVSLFYGITCYVGNALIDVFRRSTDWLPDNINNGRLDIVYWLITVLVGINFCYFLLCASLYKYKTIEDDDGFVSSS